ncbi:MAG: hypothetical protein U9O55_02525 [Patescibacteria group bacterium]|nr:hypothetical protein [Patescibacteria group bacterium]
MEFNLAGIGQNPLIAAWLLIKYLGIPTLLILGFFGGRILWLNSRQGKFCSKLEYTLLAIDIPRENEQSPKAVENMFDQISGAHSTLNFTDKWWEGKCQAKFSFEIISIDGYVQFLIHTEKNFRDLVEASIYAQYPDAEITEIDDYIENSPKFFPNEEYNLWGAEFIETNKDAYPIQTYPFFEHSLSQEFKDPMAALMEILASLRKGENVWIQYVVTMEGFSWIGRCKREINKIVGKNNKSNNGFLNQILSFFSNLAGGIAVQISGAETQTATKEKETDGALMLKLTPGEVESVKAIENKMGKIGFNVKMRIIYFAPNDVYSPARSISATVGAIKQFAGPLNGFKPESKRTRTKKFLLFSKKRLASRQRKILNAYKTRSNDLGIGNGFVLNSEELATIFHFPDSTAVKTSLVKKVASKKFEPPTNLPTE